MATSPIRPLGLQKPIGNLEMPAQAQKASGTPDSVKNITNSFGQLLDQMSATQENSDNLLQKLSAGEDVDLHQLMIASEQTDITFRVAIALRDRLVDAYNQVTRMSI